MASWQLQTNDTYQLHMCETGKTLKIIALKADNLHLYKAAKKTYFFYEHVTETNNKETDKHDAQDHCYVW